jgi:ribosomal protein L13
MIHQQDPTDVLRRAINGMLPKNFQRRERMKRVHIFPGNEHNLSCQKPIVYDPLGNDAIYSELKY